MAPRIDSFLRLVTDQRASDLHFHAGTIPTIRHHGELVPLPFRAVSAEETKRFLYEILSPAQRAAFEASFDLDFAYAIADVARFRVNLTMGSRGMSAVFRVIPGEPATIDDLGLPRVLKRLAALQNGLVLVCGPTGSGKSTTLASIVHEINLTSERHVITIEDPIEYIHKPKRSLITQREIGLHTESYATALRAALRESPDVIVVGELRDVETVQLALSAAETGTLVFATLHTNSAAKSIDRIVDLCPEEQQQPARMALSMLLRGVVGQHLLPRATGDGMIAANEVLLPSIALSHMIRENKVHHVDAHVQQADLDGSGMQSLEGILIRYVQQGLVEAEDAAPLSRNPELIRKAALRTAD